MFRELTQLNEYVYLFPRSADASDAQPNIGIIKGDDQTILIDAGNSPAHARHAMSAMADGQFAPITTIIYTHHHWDHVFGASTFKAQTTIAHASTAPLLKPLTQREWSTSFVEEEVQRQPALRPRNEAITQAIPNWYNFRVVVPNVSFEDTMAVYVDRFVLELVYVGGRHATDSIIVKLPQAKIMFLGDCYHPLPDYSRQGDESDHYALDMLETLITDEYDLYIDGHSEPRDRATFRNLIDIQRNRQGA